MCDTRRWSRRMQFCAGPQTYVFTACRIHRTDLVQGNIPNFSIIPGPVGILALNDDGSDDECDFCKEVES